MNLDVQAGGGRSEPWEVRWPRVTEAVERLTAAGVRAIREDVQDGIPDHVMMSDLEGTSSVFSELGVHPEAPTSIENSAVSASTASSRDEVRHSVTSAVVSLGHVDADREVQLALTYGSRALATANVPAYASLILITERSWRSTANVRR